MTNAATERVMHVDKERAQIIGHFSQLCDMGKISVEESVQRINEQIELELRAKHVSQSAIEAIKTWLKCRLH